ncbi:MAG: hypothetical protein HQL31_00680, partial [Planctomycetes bacterium]|nr:hypothetical protein [Planctomycetota bacterium]
MFDKAFQISLILLLLEEGDLTLLQTDHLKEHLRALLGDKFDPDEFSAAQAKIIELKKYDNDAILFRAFRLIDFLG